MADKQQSIINKIDRLNSRLKQKEHRTNINVNKNISTDNFSNTIVDDLVLDTQLANAPVDIPPDEVVDRMASQKDIKKSITIAEQVIDKNPLKLKGNRVFTIENMYEQVKEDYVGIVHQSINDCLDKLTLFYMQGNRFNDKKDIKIFLSNALQKNIFHLRKQYIDKYPLINGLESTIALVEKNDSILLKKIVDDFLNKMINNTFSN